MNILLLASHAIAEYDDIRMFTDMGHAVFCPGGYQNPREAGEGMRPGIPDAPVFPDLIAACERVRRERGDPGPMIDWAKAELAPEVIDWADIIIAHHYVDRWIAAQWDRIRHKRVVWRTCGQSNPGLEQLMGTLDGLQIVRYSPKEAGMPHYAGQDVLIRFGKYPGDYGPWIGDEAVVGNVTQHMIQRADATGYGFWMGATVDLPVKPAGPGSELLHGVGALSYPDMLDYLRHLRVYLYTGTVPAPYTLGLIEAMLSGVPVVSIGPKAWNGPEWLFEGHEIASMWAESPEMARDLVRRMLDHPSEAALSGSKQRESALYLFGIDKIKAEWAAFLNG